jgi:hypothetical protein
MLCRGTSFRMNWKLILLIHFTDTLMQCRPVLGPCSKEGLQDWFRFIDVQLFIYPTANF